MEHLGASPGETAETHKPWIGVSMVAGGGVGKHAHRASWLGGNTPQTPTLWPRECAAEVGIADGTGTTASPRVEDRIEDRRGASGRAAIPWWLGAAGLIRQLSVCNVVQGARPLKIGGPGGVPKNQHVV